MRRDVGSAAALESDASAYDVLGNQRLSGDVYSVTARTRGNRMAITKAARVSGTWLAMISAAALAALIVMIGPGADPALACSCSVSTDATAFEQSDAVFIGQLVDYRPPSTRAAMSSADPAIWTFEVSEVYKGEVAALQEVVSEVSGASCGLEIPRQGEFLVFAADEGFQMAVGDGQYYAGLCGGTRATSAGPLAVDATPSAPGPETPTATDEREPAASAKSTPTDAGSSTDYGMGLTVGAVCAVIIGTLVLAWPRFVRARS